MPIKKAFLFPAFGCIFHSCAGAATRLLKLKRTIWTRGCWKVFIMNTEALLATADYIQANPAYAGLSVQHWDFVTPLPV